MLRRTLRTVFPTVRRASARADAAASAANSSGVEPALLNHAAESRAEQDTEPFETVARQLVEQVRALARA